MRRTAWASWWRPSRRSEPLSVATLVLGPGSDAAWPRDWPSTRTSGWLRPSGTGAVIVRDEGVLGRAFTIETGDYDRERVVPGRGTAAVLGPTAIRLPVTPRPASKSIVVSSWPFGPRSGVHTSAGSGSSSSIRILLLIRPLDS
jgi:hypothetical protein